jgi:hypothetical protein
VALFSPWAKNRSQLKLLVIFFPLGQKNIAYSTFDDTYFFLYIEFSDFYVNQSLAGQTLPYTTFFFEKMTNFTSKIHYSYLFNEFVCNFAFFWHEWTSLKLE